MKQALNYTEYGPAHEMALKVKALGGYTIVIQKTVTGRFELSWCGVSLADVLAATH